MSGKYKSLFKMHKSQDAEQQTLLIKTTNTKTRLRCKVAFVPPLFLLGYSIPSSWLTAALKGFNFYRLCVLSEKMKQFAVFLNGNFDAFAARLEAKAQDLCTIINPLGSEKPSHKSIFWLNTDLYDFTSSLRDFAKSITCFIDMAEQQFSIHFSRKKYQK